ncbi:MAG: twin-arginine translocase subunit TatC [Planctomycetales bacterium]|nr:twin-arginine translocase subunit TatC [Planctomycetales bacterium]MCA9227053.1 twin-arginine translocase subunit TatC [Planctomycetales bacterium]
MAKFPSEDLFEDTKMSFGEHLEELRGSLTRALGGLLIGFLVGLVVAHYVVQFIESPLRDALEKYYLETDLLRLAEERGEELPKELVDFMSENRMITDEVFVEASQLARLAEEFPRQLETLQKTDDGQESDAKEADVRDEELAFPDGRGMLKTRIWRPLRTRVSSLSAQEAFMIWLKAGFVTGLIIASPWIFWQIWLFVAAGLYPHEKQYVYIYLPFSLILFLAGAATAFFFVFEPVLDFLFGFNRLMNIDPDPRISEWISFVLILPLGFGISFQLPLVMLFLNRIGIFSLQAYTEKWRIAILAIFVIAMFLTPADPISMLLMAVPLTFLYFLGIGLCIWMPKGRNPFAEAYDP